MKVVQDNKCYPESMSTLQENQYGTKKVIRYTDNHIYSRPFSLANKQNIN